MWRDQMMQRCKIWKEIGIEEARAPYKWTEKPKLYCVKCGQPVHLYPIEKESSASNPHFGHITANANCQG